jgi:hypothetical protein
MLADAVRRSIPASAVAAASKAVALEPSVPDHRLTLIDAL